MCKGLQALLMQAQRGLPPLRALRLVVNPDQRGNSANLIKVRLAKDLQHFQLPCQFQAKRLNAMHGKYIYHL